MSVRCRFTVIMDSLPSINLFQTVKSCYNTMGIYSPHTNQILPLNWKLLFSSLQLMQSVAEMLAYAHFKSDSYEEFGTTCFGCVSVIYSLSELLTTRWQILEILKLIDLCENFIEKSKYKI